MKEINNFQQKPDETLYQACEHFTELLMKCWSEKQPVKCPQHYLTEIQEVILFYNGLDVQTRVDSRGVVPTKTDADAKIAIQEMAEYSQKWHNETSRGRSTKTFDGLAAIQAQLNNLGREIKKFNEKVYAAPVGFDLGASVSVVPLSTYLNLGLGELAHTRLTVELVDRTVKYPKGIAENVLVGIGKFTFPIDFIILDMPEDIKIIRPLSKDYIEINDLNEPFELRTNQGDDLMPTIEEGEVVEEFRTRNDDLDTGFNDYPSYYDDDKKIHIDCSHNLKFSCMIGFEFIHANFFPLLYVNVMSRKFHNSIMKIKMVYKGNNVVGTLMNVPIFVGTFSVMTDFAVLEDMDAYRDNEMGDVIFGEPFLKEVGIKTKRFEGIITLYNGNDDITYQMVRSHPRFKHHTNEQCNKIPTLLKVSKKDERNEISHPYQMLKGFYIGVLNLGTDFIQDPSMEEWITRAHISVHELELKEAEKSLT
uniref:Reverse transcriptase domain-containing protein n=1 Tax=Tanacetum cinerariifolium TaxID=118510 RepID=A0A6L2K0N3_TANCI|nr:hypothetical protein [Tanacetum cinerariifolium]